MAQLFDRLADDSVDLIFTDPPYAREFLDCYRNLAELAACKLKPGAFLLTYCGQMYFCDVLNTLCEHLTYVWCFAIRQPGGHLQVWPYRILNDWKPLVLMAKPPVERLPAWTMDFAPGGGRDKRYHEWGQSAAEATYWIEKLTQPSGLVVDPFCGGGAIPVACLATKRRWLATEIDPANAAVARKRIRDCMRNVEAA
jgi:hypothetical protein